MSVPKTYSNKTEPAMLNHVFSYKRYFINNLDSYHGEQILLKVSKITEKPAVPSTITSATSVGGEHSEVLESPKPSPYEIIGTVMDPKIKTLDHVTTIVPLDECLPQMLTCGTVILDISNGTDDVTLASDYLKLLKDLLEREDLNEKHQSATSDDGDTMASQKRYLILVSTVMTWALTKPLDPDNPDMPFVETDFRKRKPHPNYKLHYALENEVIAIAKKYKSRIGALVVAPGMTYGGKEEALFYWFQKTWECEPFLPILGRGGNVIPLINVLDLAEIIYNLLMSFPKKLYILAVEQNITKQREIIKPLGRSNGSGMFKCIPPEDAFLIRELDQRTYDLMTLNLNMEPTFIVETMGLQWTSELSFGENVPALMKQFRKERGLKPFKIVVYGPPLVGKKTLSRLICENYGLVYISPETIVEDTLKELELRANHWKQGEVAALKLESMEEGDNMADEDEDLEDEAEQESVRITIAMLRSGRALNEEEIIGYLRKKLLSNEAQNKGWVLVGFPNNLTQATALFEKGEEQDDEDSNIVDADYFEEDAELYNNVLKKLLPDIVVSLEARDDFICEKAMRQPEDGSRLDEEVVLKRLSEFRAGDAPDLSPLNFFDELDIHPLAVNVDNHEDYSMRKPYGDVTLRMGRPCRYGKLMGRMTNEQTVHQMLSDPVAQGHIQPLKSFMRVVNLGILEIIEKAEKKEKAEKELLEAKQEKALQELKEKMKEEYEEKMEYWSELYALMREEEELCLAAAGEPMRNYLVQYIFPTLTAGLLEVAKLRPEDPIDFLAEYLFKLNPTGKMLEPGYNLKAEKLLGKINMMDEALKDLDIEIEPFMPPEESDSDNASTSRKKIDSMSAF